LSGEFGEFCAIIQGLAVVIIVEVKADLGQAGIDIVEGGFKGGRHKVSG
jgi:hypothetical protein